MAESVRLIKTQEDIEKLLELNALHSKVMRVKKPSTYDDAFATYVRERYAKKPNFLMFGAFDSDQKLHASIGMLLWRKAPWYNINNLKIRPKGLRLYDDNPYVGELFSKVFSYAESIERYRFFFLRSEKNWPREKKSPAFYETIPAWRRYSRVVELLIPANTMPEYEYAQKLLGDKTWPIDLVIESGQLKQSYRPTAHLLKFGSE